MNTINKWTFWICLVCGVINIFLLFMSLNIPEVYHLKNQHLVMIGICLVGMILNYYSDPAPPNPK